MIKFVVRLEHGGNLYGFGLAEASLNRLEFNQEPIFFDFGYTDHPELFGLILYVGEFETPEEAAENVDTIKRYCIPFFNAERGVTPETLRVFFLTRSVMQKMRSTPYWAFDTQIEITSPQDKQLIFAGRTEQDIEEYFRKHGLISPRTKRTYKGFGKFK